MKNIPNREKEEPFAGKGDKQKPPVLKPSYLWVTILLFILVSLLINSFFQLGEVSWLEFERDMLSKGDVGKIVIVNKEWAEIYIKEQRLEAAKYEEVAKKFYGQNVGPHYQMQIGTVEVFEKKMENSLQALGNEGQVEISYESRANWGSIISWLLPIGLILLFWFFMMRNVGTQGAGSSIFRFGKSTAKLLDKDQKSKITFEDVAGLEEAKIEVKEIVDFLKNPEVYTRLGAKIPKGVMLVGPPGTGKTLMAKAVAGEAQVPFFSLSGSEFVEMFVGVGASRVRDLFKRAKEVAPSIIFIDEIDAIGRSRGKVEAFQTNDERENTLNQLLTELDGFGTNTGVIVLAATNRADILDSALLRPGRFDRHIYLELPNLKERKEIFKVHLKPIKIDDSLNLERLSALTPGFSGADIANICNEAALIAARKNKDVVSQDDFSESTDRIVGGLEKRSKIISPEEKKIIAYHEAGHAIASWYLKNVDHLVKVSIIPRGKSLGAAWYVPEEHQIITKSTFIDQLCAALGGRAAEDLIFNEISSGALDDLEKVTKQAYNMVAYYGLDKKLGHISFYDSTGQNERLMRKPYSEAIAELIDNEVRMLIAEAYDRTYKLLELHHNELHNIAELLLSKEVIYEEDLKKILGDRVLNGNPSKVEISNH